MKQVMFLALLWSMSLAAPAMDEAQPAGSWAGFVTQDKTVVSVVSAVTSDETVAGMTGASPDVTELDMGDIESKRLVGGIAKVEVSGIVGTGDGTMAALASSGQDEGVDFPEDAADDDDVEVDEDGGLDEVDDK